MSYRLLPSALRLIKCITLNYEHKQGELAPALTMTNSKPCQIQGRFCYYARKHAGLFLNAAVTAESPVYPDGCALARVECPWQQFVNSRCIAERTLASVFSEELVQHPEH